MHNFDWIIGLIAVQARNINVQTRKVEDVKCDGSFLDVSQILHNGWYHNDIKVQISTATKQNMGLTWSRSPLLSVPETYRDNRVDLAVIPVTSVTMQGPR